MRIRVVLQHFLLPALAAGGAYAQSPDCRVLLSAANTAQHAAQIVVAPSTPVTLEVRCSGTAQPTYRWSTGATTFSITASAPAAQGASQAYTVDVSLNGGKQTLTGTLQSAAAGTPSCALNRTPAGPVPVFANVQVMAVCPGATSYTWTGGYDLRGQGTTSVTHVNIVNVTDNVTIDVVPSNANGPGAAAGITIPYVASAPACRVDANPQGRVPPSVPVALTATCDGSPTSHSWAHGAFGATVVVNPAVTATYTLRASNAAGAGAAAAITIPVATLPATLHDYTGHWYGGTPENGWGMTLNQHGQSLFGVIYFYDATGQPMWAVMPGGTWNADFTAFTGNLYTPQGAPYTAYDASQLVPGSATGSITLTFARSDLITIAYTLGYSQWDPRGRPITTYGQKQLQPLIVNEGRNPSGLAIPDMWWGGAAQNGWGISVNQRFSEVFAAWFTYGDDRRPTWFIVSGSSWSFDTLAATIYRVTGSPWLGVPYDASAVVTATAGLGTLAFGDDSHGAFNYTIGGVNGAKAIERQPF